MCLFKFSKSDRFRLLPSHSGFPDRRRNVAVASSATLPCERFSAGCKFVACPPLGNVHAQTHAVRVPSPSRSTIGPSLPARNIAGVGWGNTFLRDLSCCGCYHPSVILLPYHSLSLPIHIYRITVN